MQQRPFETCSELVANSAHPCSDLVSISTNIAYWSCHREGTSGWVGRWRPKISVRGEGLVWTGGRRAVIGGAGVGRQVGWVAGRVDGGMPLDAFKSRRFARDVRQKVKETSSESITSAKSEHPYRTSGPAWSSSACHEPPKSLNLGCNFANFRSKN